MFLITSQNDSRQMLAVFNELRRMNVDVIRSIMRSCERFGGKLAFWCPVDIQRTMIEGSLEEIDQYVKRMVETLGSRNGGLVSMAAYSTPADIGHTPEKLEAIDVPPLNEATRNTRLPAEPALAFYGTSLPRTSKNHEIVQ